MIRHLAAPLSVLVLLFSVVAAAQLPSHPRGAPPVVLPPATALSKGENLFAYHCALCHGDGPGHPGTSALAYKYKGEEPSLLTERSDLDPDAIASDPRAVM